MTKKQLPTRKPRIVVLYGSAGGGHKSSATAIIDELHLAYGDAIETKMIDVLKEIASAPFDKVPEAYALALKTPRVWKQLYNLGDGPMRTKAIQSAIGTIFRKQAREFLDEHRPDLIVSVYGFANSPTLEELSRTKPKIPFVTVVTDMVTTPYAWYDTRVDLCIVPTEQARAIALESGLDDKQIKIIGLPVAQKFTQQIANKAVLRANLGWPTDRPMILLMAGGEGIGPLDKIAAAIDQAGLEVGLAIVTGKNTRLKHKLENREWTVPTFVYGYSQTIHEFMNASDIFVTKAGPGNISEAFIVGLPMILYSRVPGQEEGNVDYVVHEGAGVWAPEPEEIVIAIKRWIKHPKQLEAAAHTSKTLATPNATKEIAKVLGSYIGME